MTDPLNVTGILVEGVGLGITGWGIAKTWKHHGTEGFFSPLRNGLVRAEEWARRRLHMKPRRRNVVVMGAAAEGNFTFSASVAVGYAPPDLTDLAAAISAIHERLVGLRRDFDAFAASQSSRTQEIEREVASVSSDLRRQAEAVTELERRVSTDGLRIEAFGLSLVGLGLILQGVAQAL